MAGFFFDQAGCEAGPATSRTFGGLISSVPLDVCQALCTIFLTDLVEGQFLVEAPPAERPQPTLQACTVFLCFLYLVEAQITELPQPDVEAHMPRFP